MMSLIVRKVIVLGLIGIIFLLANILVVANWVSDTGIAEKASWLRREFLTGTAIAVILTLLVLLVSPRNTSGQAIENYDDLQRLDANVAEPHVRPVILEPDVTFPLEILQRRAEFVFGPVGGILAGLGPSV